MARSANVKSHCISKGDTHGMAGACEVVYRFEEELSLGMQRKDSSHRDKFIRVVVELCSIQGSVTCLDDPLPPALSNHLHLEMQMLPQW